MNPDTPRPDKDEKDDSREPVAAIVTSLLWNVAAAAIIIAICLCFAFLTGSCTTTRIVPVPTYHHDTIRATITRRDSIYLRDSIYIYDRGDTVRETRTRYLFADRYVHDTLRVTVRDTVTIVPTDRITSDTDQKDNSDGIGFWPRLLIIAVAIIAIAAAAKRVGQKIVDKWTDIM